MTTRYTVYREYVSGEDGEKGFETLSEAEREFEDASDDRRVVSVELIDNVDAGNPSVLAWRWPTAANCR